MGLNVTPISITGHYWSLWWGPEVAFQGLWRIVILKARLKGTHLWFGNSLLSLVSLTFFCSDSVWKMKKHNIKTSVSVSTCRNLQSLSTASHTRYRCVYCFKKHYVTYTAAVSYHRAVPIFPIRFPLLRSCNLSYVPMLCSWTHFFMFTRINTILFADVCVNLLLLTHKCNHSHWDKHKQNFHFYFTLFTYTSLQNILLSKLLRPLPNIY